MRKVFSHANIRDKASPVSISILEVTGEDRDLLNLIFHLPKTEKGRQELQKRVAAVHVEAISLLLQKVAYSQEQKERLLRGLDAYLKE